MLGLFRWLAGRPLWFLHALGAALGWATWLASPSYRRRFAANVRQAGLAPAAARGAVAAAGRMVAEAPYLWLRPAGAPIGPRLEWTGRERLAEALRAGRGVVVLTPHMGSFEVTAQAVAQEFGSPEHPLTVLFRPARQAALRRVMDESRRRAGLATAPATLAGVRQMIRALRRGEIVGLLPDQVPPAGMGVWAPFFGRPAYTMTLAARLVQQTGAAPLLIWGERLPRGAGFRVHVSELGEALPAADPAQGTAGPPQGSSTPSGGDGRDAAGGGPQGTAGPSQGSLTPSGGDGRDAIVGGHGQAESAALVVNRAMERLIRQAPAQYLWGYNRYKTPRSTGPAG